MAPFFYGYTAIVVIRSIIPLPHNRISYLEEAIGTELIKSELVLLDINVGYENNTVYSLDITFAPFEPISEDEFNSTVNLALSFNIKTGNNSLTTIKKTWKPIFCFKIETYEPCG